jgi:beta-fructofuranosidase
MPCRRYAARIVETGDGLVILGFADTPDGVDFIGHITDPEPVDVTQDGLLEVRPTLRAAE